MIGVVLPEPDQVHWTCKATAPCYRCQAPSSLTTVNQPQMTTDNFIRDIVDDPDAHRERGPPKRSTAAVRMVSWDSHYAQRIHQATKTVLILANSMMP
jgi:hypothetical protein